MHRRFPAILLFAAFVLGGCAVVTVDVDVYKGPLANTVEVQAEQAIALAMGAKPLLIQLRDYLEVDSYNTLEKDPANQGKPPANREKALQTALVRFRTNSWYRSGFFAPQSGSRAGGPRLRNDHAIRVNEILVLYEDRAPWDFSPLLERGAAIYARYQQAYRTFRPPGHEADLKLWREWEGAFVAGVRGQTNCSGLLSHAYRRLLVPETNNYCGVWIAWRDPRPLGRLLLTNALGTETGLRSANATNDSALFDLIRRSPEVERHAACLFQPKENRLRTQFTRRVREIGDSFLAARTAAHEFLTAALEAHTLATGTSLAGSEFVSPAARQAVESAAAEVIAATLDPKHLVEEVMKGVRLNPQDPVLAPLARRLPRLDRPPDAWSSMDLDQVHNAIKQALAEEGAALSAGLRALDERLVRATDDHGTHWFGLAAGPIYEDPGVVPPEEIGAAINQLRGVTESSFAGGRLSEGLETLIERYLSSAGENRWFENRSESSEFTLLLDALVAFGQKAATLGNIAGLLDSMDDRRVKRYMAVLQYVGNAILVQVDELKNRAQHRERLLREATLLAEALREAGFTNRAFTTNRALFFDAHEAAPTQRMDAKDVLEHLLGTLRAEQIQATLTAPSAPNAVPAAGATPGTPDTGPSPTDPLAAAIEKVTQMKNGRIYLRPASAYLRSTYPATTVSANGSLIWANELQRQAWRAVPIVGGPISQTGCLGSADMQELDKQSWQNINHVRVSGAGKVNQVIAKDDVGNWYVKSYSAETKEVIATMRNLATFSAGGAFGPALSSFLPTPATGAAAPSPFASQLNVALAEDRTQVGQTWSSLTNRLLGGVFTNGITAAWSLLAVDTQRLDRLRTVAFASDLQNLYRDAIRSEAVAITNAASSMQPRATDAAILAVLRALKRYHAAVLPRLAFVPEDRALELRARQAFTAAVRRFIDDVLEERERALDRSEARLEIIHAAVEPVVTLKPIPPKKGAAATALRTRPGTRTVFPRVPGTGNE